MEVRVEATYGAAKRFIAAGLEGFNRRQLSGKAPKSFAVTVRDGGSMRGGLMANGIGDWIYISLLWVEDEFRRRGFGAALLQAAETEAKHRGAKGILVDTFSFQAPGFYEKHGFAAYGRVEDCPKAGMTWYRFQKAL